MRCRGEFTEYAILAPNELPGFCEFIVGPPERIVAKPLPIRLVGGEAFNIVDPDGRCRRPFMRSEIANKVGTAARDRLAPVTGIFVEGFDIEAPWRLMVVP